MTIPARPRLRWLAVPFVLAAAVVASGLRNSPRVEADEKTPPAAQPESLDARFATKVKPFVETYCASCHGPKKQAASLDLSANLSVAGVVKNAKEWEIVLDKLHTKEMPPDTTK